MTKPKWEDAPDFANWLARDQDGTWFWYEAKPVQSNGFWTRKSVKYDFQQAMETQTHWSETLEPKPDGEKG